jgi:hypothetical protein
MHYKFIFTAFFIFALILSGASAENVRAQMSDCTRATPVRVVKKRVFPNARFVLSRDKRTGTETVKFGNGDKLVITNAGCEYYNWGFRFETNRFSARASDTKYWFAQLIKLLEETEKGIDAPVQMGDGIKALKKYLKANKNPKLEEEIDYGGADIRNFVTVNKIQKLSRNKFALEAAFSIGPL